MPRGCLRNFCEKTQLCKFHQAGICTKGRKCAFAHSEAALRAPPNLSCTKLCPTLIATGACDDEACRFAHNKEQLRRLNVPSKVGPKPVAQPLPTGRVAAAVAAPAPADDLKAIAAPALAPNIVIYEASPGFAPPVVSLDGVMMRKGDALGENVACGGTSWARNISSCSTECSFDGTGSATLSDFSRSSTPLDLGSVFTSETSESASADGDGAACVEASGEQEVGPNGQPRAARNMFHKTRLCNYFAQGRCRKGTLCRFAHGTQDQRPLPDLSCTKLCPELLRTGCCCVADCPFAHHQEELRMRPRQLEVAVAAGLAAAVGAQPSAVGEGTKEGEAAGNGAVPRGEEVSPTARWAIDHSVVNLQHCVKNTFIDIQEPREQELHRRSRSAPCRVTFLADQAGAGDASPLAPKRRQRLSLTIGGGNDAQQPSAQPAPAAMPSLAVPRLH